MIQGNSSKSMAVSAVSMSYDVVKEASLLTSLFLCSSMLLQDQCWFVRCREDDENLRKLPVLRI
ncbi:unnamed protein product [Ilex paraguariensis]|uniref:Uncharacterized protein n=1 Tax=Ilex paraguariensis TaxID=185542 RepID=A0ABC8TV58_9AQUA